ncbi:MAG: alpha/beta hydrolase [Desulfobacterales bacterium]|nr:alpha/beta hydrolase [Desulfobacterales bacterium]
MRLKRLAPTCTLVTLPGCGHFPAMEQPGSAPALIKSYLRETLVKAG